MNKYGASDPGEVPNITAERQQWVGSRLSWQFVIFAAQQHAMLRRTAEFSHKRTFNSAALTSSSTTAMERKTSKTELLGKLKAISQPKAHGLTQETLEKTLIDFCAGCPDPVQARWLIVECLEQMSDDELIDRALNMPTVAMSSVPVSIIPSNHPARITAI